MQLDQAAGLRRMLAADSRDLTLVTRGGSKERKHRPAQELDAAGTKREIILIVSRDSASIIGAYAIIKHARRESSDAAFALVITGVKSEQEAVSIHQNIADAARRFLKTRVELMGYIDERKAEAATGHEMSCRRAKGIGHVAR